MSLINQYFSTDHRRLDCLFDAFVSCLNQSDETGYKYYKLFYKELIKHIKWEEDILFPLIESIVPMSKGPTAVMCAEHLQIKDLLMIIDEKLIQGPSYIQQELAQLSDILTAHNMKEENILYPMIDEQIDEQQLAKIFSKMN